MKRILPYICLFLTCFFFVGFFSPSTSPYYGNLYVGDDSAVFKLIGKYWAEGFIPYVDLWDQKGPLIYVIDCIGYLLTGNETGIFFIQIVFLYFTSIYTYKSINIVLNNWKSLSITIVIILSLSINYEGGNLVEEYLLPFLAFSYYYLLKYVLGGYQDKKALNIFYFATGLSVSFCLFTRLTNALIICSSAFMVSIYLVIDKKYKLLIQGIFFILLGFLIITIPITAYFYINNAIEDMWYGTFEYNIEYALSNRPLSTSIAHFIGKFLNCFIIIIVSSYLLINKRWRDASLFFVTALIPLVWFINSAQYAHYGMITFPLLCTSFVVINGLSKAKYLRVVKLSFNCIIPLYLLSCVLLRVYQYKMVIFPTNKKVESPTMLHQLCEIYNIDKNSLIIYNNSGADYLKENVKPGMRFFFLHDFLSEKGPSIEEKMIESLKENRVKWLLVPGQIKNKRIKKTVDDNYRIVAKDKGYTIFKML